MTRNFQNQSVGERKGGLRRGMGGVLPLTFTGGGGGGGFFMLYLPCPLTLQISSRLPEALLLASKFDNEWLSLESPPRFIGSVGGPESVLIKESRLELEGERELQGVEVVKYIP